MVPSSRPRKWWPATASSRRPHASARSRSSRRARRAWIPAPVSRSGSSGATVADPEPAPALPEHYFRHEFGRLVPVLTRRFGVHRVELCEDAVQTALLRAVQSWPQRGLPDDRSAWLYRVALNEVLGALRRARRTESFGDDVDQLVAEGNREEGVFLEHEVKDDQLRMLFVCANPDIPRESKIVFALK